MRNEAMDNRYIFFLIRDHGKFLRWEDAASGNLVAIYRYRSQLYALDYDTREVTPC
jgi:hypothetical protein